MYGSPRAMPTRIGKAQCLHHDSLTGHRRIAVNFDGQHAVRVSRCRSIRLRARHALHDRIHDLEMRRIECEHDFDRAIFGLRDAAETLVILDIAFRQYVCVLAVELIEERMQGLA